MKEIKQIFCIFVTILAISCKKEPEIAVTPKIEFYPSVTTKAYINSAQDAEFKEGFSVFACKTERPDPLEPSTTPLQSVEIMNNYKVHYDGSNWTYNIPDITPAQPDVWWGLNCDHEFLAVFPYTQTGTEYTFGQQDKTYHYTGISTVDAQNNHVGKDIMYARHQQYFKFGDQPAPIILNMKHALSAISIKVRNASENNIEYIDVISISGLHTKITDLAIPRDVSKEPTMVIDPNSIGTYNYPKTTGTAQAPFIQVGETAFKNLLGPNIIIPQDFLKLTVTFKMSVKFSEIETPKVLSYYLNKVPVQGDVATQYKYLPGKHYIYNIDILNDYINCSVKVVDWIDDTPIELT